MEKFFDFIVKYKAVVIAGVVILFVAMIAALGMMIYNSTLRIDETEIAGVYGMNSRNNTKITFDNVTADAVIKAVNGMKYDGTDNGLSAKYKTYVCIEMIDGTKYHIKYCDSSSVYISQGAARIGRYVNTDNSEAMSDILAITSALEEKYGPNSESVSSDATSSTVSDSVSSATENTDLSAVNSVEQ